MGSTHDGDVSDVESGCSALSDMEAPMTRTRGRRKQPRTVSQEDEETSEVESCSSAVSASNAGRSTRRSMRRKMIPESSDPAHVEAGDAKIDGVQEAESCGSVVSESQRVTRSQRKTALTRSSTKQQTEDLELSDTDSYLSSVSGADVFKSTRRRTTRSRRQTGSIPIHLDEAEESSLSPAPTRRSSRAARGKTAATVDVSEPQSCDSEGFESGPTYRMQTRGQGKAKAVDSDSELTDVHSPIGSPCSTRSRGTPCSSRTGSGNSSQGAPASRHSVKQLSIVVEKGVEPAEVDTSLNDSRLESTAIAEDADRTLLEEDESQTLEEKEQDGVSDADPRSNEEDAIKEKRGVSVSEEDSHVSHSPGCAEETVGKPAVTVGYQQGEPCEENKDGDTSEMERMQETDSSSEPLEPRRSVTEALCERTSETIEETEERDTAMEVADVEDEDAVVETRPSEEEEMEVGPLNSDGQQVVDSSEVRVESIQVTSSQQHSITVHNIITVDSDPEQRSEDVTVQNRTTVSLLESSEDEDEDEEEERAVSEEEHMAEERGGPSNKSEAAGTSVGGLFMIDTRPGQEADEQYYMEKPMEKEEETAVEERVEQEEQEEFVDEEGDDDDDDEDANILFLSRNPLL